MGMNIAIDGPAGAGKSTIARKVAEKLSFLYVDTGAMYRAIAVYFLRNGLDPAKEEDVKQVCEKADISIAYLSESGRYNRASSDGRNRKNGVVEFCTSSRTRKTAGNPERTCKEEFCCDGRPGYWYKSAAGSGG